MGLRDVFGGLRLRMALIRLPQREGVVQRLTNMAWQGIVPPFRCIANEFNN